uniref:Uncharacterized protein n=1 Tax=Oryza glumipatula TaxID=40148 RepID=A0A0E0AG79_9ORYZ
MDHDGHRVDGTQGQTDINPHQRRYWQRHFTSGGGNTANSKAALRLVVSETIAAMTFAVASQLSGTGWSGRRRPEFQEKEAKETNCVIVFDWLIMLGKIFALNMSQYTYSVVDLSNVLLSDRPIDPCHKGMREHFVDTGYIIR